MLRSVVLVAALCATAHAFTVPSAAVRPAAASQVLAARAVAPSMVVEPSVVDAASTTMLAAGLSIPIPAYSPAKVRACKSAHAQAPAQSIPSGCGGGTLPPDSPAARCSAPPHQSGWFSCCLQAFVMMFFNLVTIFGMTIQGKGLAKGINSGMSPKEAHDDMVASFGLTWLLSGTAFGHILGAGAILGCSSAGWF